ncbi:hypothetical protein [Desulfobulbus sp.]|uniref:hypothetical protein n=1 Tax=Desulfobulbus sp. TaxID=895 RepID=UPI00286F32E5|nr:hypothetical protein [Desulfobulbus sp.]
MGPHIKGKIKKTLSSLAGQSAQSLFPDLFQNESAKAESSTVIVPPPPDMNWLAHADFGEQQKRADSAPPALLALGGKPQQELIAQKLARMGYVVTTASSTAQALERLSANKYRLVFCGADAAFEEVLRFVNRLTTDQRRHIYFVLVGADLHTFYDLEALALSANLVINTRDLPSLELILIKGLRDYEQLFRPLLDILGSTP